MVCVGVSTPTHPLPPPTHTHTHTWGQTDTGNEEWGPNCEALVIVAPARQEEVVSFPKSMALHAALFSMELNEVPKP